MAGAKNLVGFLTRLPEATLCSRPRNLWPLRPSLPSKDRTGGRMDVRPTPLPRKPWIPVLVALALLFGLGALMLWQWQALEQRGREEAQQRFQLESQEVKQRVEARMRAYEMVLRGMSGLIVG